MREDLRQMHINHQDRDKFTLFESRCFNYEIPKCTLPKVSLKERGGKKTRKLLFLGSQDVSLLWDKLACIFDHVLPNLVHIIQYIQYLTRDVLFNLIVLFFFQFTNIVFKATLWCSIHCFRAFSFFLFSLSLSYFLSLRSSFQVPSLTPFSVPVHGSFSPLRTFWMNRPVL